MPLSEAMTLSESVSEVPEKVMSESMSEFVSVSVHLWNGPIGSTKIKSKTILVSSSIFEVFVKEVKCVGTSWAEIAFDHQVSDKCSLFIDCL